MTNAEKITLLIKKEKEDEMLAFLRSLDIAERKELFSALKKLSRELSEYKQTGKLNWEPVGTPGQREIIISAGFVCAPNQKEFQKNFSSWWILDPKKFNKIKDWYCPGWFSDLVNNQESFSLWITYDWIMQLTEEGFLRPSQKLIARILPRVIFVRQEGSKYSWVPDLLLKRSVTLDDHIWLLFEEETDLYMSDRYLNFGNESNKSEGHWILTFKYLLQTGRIERKRLLKETLLASNKNFNKNQSGWFIDLFAALGPTKEELLELQSELYSIISSPNSKVVTEGISRLKKIATESSFDVNTMLDSMPTVLTSNTKSTIAAGLMLLEQGAKKKKTIHSRAAMVACQGLLIADDAVQTRAAKLIVKFGNSDDQALRNEIASYWEGLLKEARTILGPFNNKRSDEPGGEEGATQLVFSHDPQSFDPVSPIETTNELIFLSAQAFDNNDAMHFFLLPDSLIKLHSQLKGKLISQMQPALQRALQMTKSGLRSNQGFLDHMLGLFFIDVCIHIARKNPDDSAELTSVFENFTQKDANEVRKWMAIDWQDSYISRWTKYSKDPFYEPYQQWLIETLAKFRRGEDLPLLSTPTHYPGWIDPVKLVERIMVYAQKKELADGFDLRLAIARSNLKDTSAAIQLAKSHLTGEWLDLLLFLFTKDADPVGIITQPEAWMMASLTKKPVRPYAALEPYGYYQRGMGRLTGQYPWKSLVEEYMQQTWDHQKRDYVKVPAMRKALQIDFSDQYIAPLNPPEIKTWKQKLGLKSSGKVKPGGALLHDYITIKTDFFSNESNDIRRAMLMLPANSEVFIAQMVRRCLKFPDFIGEADKRIVIQGLQLMYELWEENCDNGTWPGEMAHIFLASSLLTTDKTAVQTAAELWIRFAPLGRVNVPLVGRIIGLHESIEFYPLKRFTDLIMQSLFRISPKLNQLLQTMLEHVFPELPDEPIRNLKKLLEIYGEVVSINNSSVKSLPVITRFEVWKTNEGLKKVIGKIAM